MTLMIKCSSKHCEYFAKYEKSERERGERKRGLEEGENRLIKLTFHHERVALVIINDKYIIIQVKN